jgi:hypothetical protein
MYLGPRFQAQVGRKKSAGVATATLENMNEDEERQEKVRVVAYTQ